jgi:di/tricarboxylate transporter
MIEPPSLHALAAMVVTLVMFIAYARGRLGTEIVSLLTIAVIAVGLYFFPLPHTEPTDGLALAFSGFGHYALITICALMVMGRALVVTGALDPAARLLERVFKYNQQLGLLLSLAAAICLSMGINDTTVVVLLMPIFVSLAARGGLPASKTLIPLNAAVMIGGMATTIGTSTNILVVSIARDLGMRPMSVFHFTPVVLAAALVAFPYLWLVMPRLLHDNSPEGLQAPRRFHARLRVPAGSDLVGKHFDQVIGKLPEDFRFEQRPAGAFEAGHRLHVSGTHDALEEALLALKGHVAPDWLVERIRRMAAQTGDDIQVVEMVVTADSRLTDRTLATSGIGDLHSVAVLGIHKPARLLTHHDDSQPTAEMRIQEGDVLLAMGVPAALQEFASADSLLQLEGAREVPRRSKAMLAAVIMLGSVGLASVGLLPIAIAALGGAILMFLTGCLKFDRVGRALSAQVIVLIAANIAIGKLVLETGAAAWLGQAIASALQVLPSAGVLAAIMLFATLLTNFASHTTAATVGTPIAFAVATQLGLPAEPVVLAVMFGCNLGYATPIAYQTNVLIMAEGGYTFGDYLRTGVPLIVLMVVTLSAALALTYAV